MNPKHMRVFQVLSKAWAPVLRAFVAAQLAPLDARIRELEQRLADAETKGVMTYRGVWQAQITYPAGGVVTRSGSAWHTTVATCGVPGGPAAVDRRLDPDGETRP